MSWLNKVFGSLPTVPELPKLDLGAEQQKAIANNIAALPSDEQLVSAANLFSRQQVDQMLRAVIPNFDTMRSTAGANIESLLKGEIPTDISEAVQQSDAARSLGKGFAGSGMGRNLVARDLGLTSLGLTERGLSSAESWINNMDRLYAPSQIHLSSMFVSPGEQASFDVEERNMQFSREWLANQIKAMPDPVLNTAWQVIHQIGMSYFGGAKPLAPTGTAALNKQQSAGLGGTSGWNDSYTQMSDEELNPSYGGEATSGGGGMMGGGGGGMGGMGGGMGGGMDAGAGFGGGMGGMV